MIKGRKRQQHKCARMEGINVINGIIIILLKVSDAKRVSFMWCAVNAPITECLNFAPKDNKSAETAYAYILCFADRKSS